MSVDAAKDKAARLLKKRASISSAASSELTKQHKKHGSMSTISFMDETANESQTRPQVRMENTYQLTPGKKFPSHNVKNVLREVLEGYLSEERYEPDLCRQMSKTISEVVKARVKEMVVPRYKIISIIHIGQLNDQGLRMGSRCLWDQGQDTFASYEYRNNSLFAVGTVFGVYAE